MALSMIRHQETKWETVKSRKGDRKKKDAEQENTKPAAGARQSEEDPAKQAFAAFDALHFETDAAVGSDNATSPQPEARSSPPPEDAAKSTGKKKDRKKKQQQAKQLPPPQPVPATQSPGMTLQILKTILKDVTVRYPDNEIAQLQFVADKFLPAFRDKPMPFPAEIYIKPVQETVDMFVGFLSPKMETETLKFLGSKSIEALTESFAAFCRALFDLISGPKAQLKDHLGLVVLIAAIARASPVAVVRCSKLLMAEGPRFTAPNKFPVLVWIFAQAERSAAGSMLALWLRTILPQLVGVDLEQAKGKKGKGKKDQQSYVLDPKSYTIATDCLRKGLSGGSSAKLSSKIRQAAQNGLVANSKGTEVHEPVVSLSSLNTIQCAIFLELATPIPAQIVSDLEDLYPTLRSLAFSGASDTALHDFLKSSLEFAAKSEGGYLGAGDRIVSEATENVIECLLKDSECFDVWTTKHKGQIRGSCRVLQHLLHARPKSFQSLLKTPGNGTAFLKMVKKFQERHGILLAQGKGWQGACARGAHEACKKFLGNPKDIARKGGKGMSAMSLIVVLVILGLAVAFVAANWDDVNAAGQEFLQQSEQGKVVAKYLAGVEVYVKRALDSDVGQWLLSKKEKLVKNFDS